MRMFLDPAGRAFSAPPNRLAGGYKQLTDLFPRTGLRPRSSGLKVHIPTPVSRYAYLLDSRLHLSPTPTHWSWTEPTTWT